MLYIDHRMGVIVKLQEQPHIVSVSGHGPYMFICLSQVADVRRVRSSCISAQNTRRTARVEERTDVDC